MTKKYQFSAVFLLFYFLGFAQEKAIDTVYIFDSQLKNSKKFHKIENLDEADLLKNSTNLSEVLRFQSPVYIKENGRGMVSSPSFRGTSAQQTAFIWNGINVNSQFLGQGDINNLNLLGYDNLQVKSGGGTRNAAQMGKDNIMETVGGKIIGKNAPDNLLDTTRKIRTVEVKIK